MGPIMIGGCPRSGTTLLRVMLDSHREIVAPPETKLGMRVSQQMRQSLRAAGPVLEGSVGIGSGVVALAYGSVIRVILNEVRVRAGARWVADKTPSNVLAFPDLQYMLPDSPLVHVIRDGRDVVASLLQQSWRDLDSGRPLEMTRSPAAAAEHWVRCVRAAQRVAQGRVHEVRYEALVLNPEPTLRGLMEAIGVPFDPRMLQHHAHAHDLPRSEASSGAVASPVHTHSLGKWKQQLSVEAQTAVLRVAGDLLVELGYAEGPDWVGTAPSA